MQYRRPVSDCSCHDGGAHLSHPDDSATCCIRSAHSILASGVRIRWKATTVCCKLARGAARVCCAKVLLLCLSLPALGSPRQPSPRQRLGSASAAPRQPSAALGSRSAALGTVTHRHKLGTRQPSRLGSPRQCLGSASAGHLGRWLGSASAVPRQCLGSASAAPRQLGSCRGQGSGESSDEGARLLARGGFCAYS